MICKIQTKCGDPKCTDSGCVFRRYFAIILPAFWVLRSLS
jgi:hypothetical protein